MGNLSAFQGGMLAGMTKPIDWQRPIWHIREGKLNWDRRSLNQKNLSHLKKEGLLLKNKVEKIKGRLEKAGFRFKQKTMDQNVPLFVERPFDNQPQECDFVYG